MTYPELLMDRYTKAVLAMVINSLLAVSVAEAKTFDQIRLDHCDRIETAVEDIFELSGTSAKLSEKEQRVNQQTIDEIKNEMTDLEVVIKNNKKQQAKITDAIAKHELAMEIRPKEIRYESLADQISELKTKATSDNQKRQAKYSASISKLLTEWGAFCNKT